MKGVQFVTDDAGKRTASGCHFHLPVLGRAISAIGAISAINKETPSGGL